MEPSLECCTIGTVIVVDQIFWGAIPWNRLSDLMAKPLRGWTRRDADPTDLSSADAEYNEREQARRFVRRTSVSVRRSRRNRRVRRECPRKFTNSPNSGCTAACLATVYRLSRGQTMNSVGFLTLRTGPRVEILWPGRHTQPILTAQQHYKTCKNPG